MSDAPYLKAGCHSLTMGIKGFLSPELFDLQTFKIVGASGPIEISSQALVWSCGV